MVVGEHSGLKTCMAARRKFLCAERRGVFRERQCAAYRVTKKTLRRRLGGQKAA